MASSGVSSGSSGLQNSGSENGLQQLMEQRKRKRMISNRESARRSRMRKQKHLDDLTAELTQLRTENSQISTSLNVTTQHYLNFEAENSILRAQIDELSHRLESLNEIINFVNASNGFLGSEEFSDQSSVNGVINSLWNNYACVSQPIMACVDMFQC